MDTIVVRCKMCKHAMKFSLEKAGKRAKCPKCDAIVLIKADEPPKDADTNIAAAADNPSAAVSAPPPVLPAPEVEEENYGVYTDPELEERRKAMQAEEENKRKKKDRKKLPKVTRKTRAIPDAELWQKVRVGLLIVSIGVWIWFFTHILQGSFVLIGTVELPEYAKLIATNLQHRGGEDPLPRGGEFWDIPLIDVYLGMIAGSDFQGYARFCIVTGSIFYFFQAIAWGIGNVVCLQVPRRFGTFLQLIVGLVSGFLNFLFQFIFKFLPVIGVMGYVMVPYLTPEIAMTEYNMERRVPIQIMWSGAPFWEYFLSLLMLFTLYLQPTIGCVFIWSIGTSIKDESLESGGKGLTQMGLGSLFILVAYHLLSICGASPVLVIVLRVLYCLWFFFLLLFILRYAMLIIKCRAVLYDRINPKNELEE